MRCLLCLRGVVCGGGLALDRWCDGGLMLDRWCDGGLMLDR